MQPIRDFIRSGFICQWRIAICEPFPQGLFKTAPYPIWNPVTKHSSASSTSAPNADLAISARGLTLTLGSNDAPVDILKGIGKAKGFNPEKELPKV